MWLNEINEWYQVQLPSGDLGWISQSLINNQQSSFNEENKNNNAKIETINSNNSNFDSLLDERLPKFKKIIVVNFTDTYQEASNKSNFITEVKKGDIFRPIDKLNDWFKISINSNITAWISKNDIRELKYPSVYVKNYQTEGHQAPNEKSIIINIIKDGTELIPIDEINNWFLVKLSGGRQGWVLKSDVHNNQCPKIKIVDDAKVYELTSRESQIKTSISKGEALLPLLAKENWFKVSLPNDDVGWIDGQYITYIKPEYSLSLFSDHCFRTGPGIEYQIITTVSRGSKFEILDEKFLTSTTWYLVRLASGEIGWIGDADYQEKSLLTDISPKSETLKEKYITERSFLATLTARSTSLAYGGPGANYAVVGTIQEGTIYKPLRKQFEWYLLELSTKTNGWVPAYRDVLGLTSPVIVFTLDQSNLRDGPGLEYNIIKQISPATDITIIQKLADYYYVRLMDGTKGYIKKDLVFEE